MNRPASPGAPPAANQLDLATEEAIAWMVRLGSGRSGAADQQGFDRWHASDARHAEAWRRLDHRLHQQIGQPLGAVRTLDSRLPGQAREARQALLAPASTSRRHLLRALAVAAPVGAGLLVADRIAPLGGLVADFSTGTAERRSFTLADGSELSLNARSQVDADFSARDRQLRLLGGDIVVRVAPDAARPFSVLTGDGLARVAAGAGGAAGGPLAEGPLLTVRKEAGATRVAVLADRAEVLGPQGQRLVLLEQEGALLDAAGLARLAASQVDGADWLRGLLVVDRRPLGWVLAEMQRWRRDVLRVSDAAAGILVQGVFPLGDIDRALVALAETLPVRIARYGPWLTRIDVR